MRLFIVLFSVLILFFPNMSYGEGLDYEQVLEELEKNISAPSQKSEKLIAQLIGEWNNLSREQKINVYIYQAVFLTYQGNYNASVVSLKNAEKLAPRDALQSKIHQSLSANYIALKQYSEALTLMEDSLQRIDKYDDIEIKLSSYVRLANLALVLNAYQDMREFAAKSAELSAKINDVRQHCFSLLMLAVVDLKENRSGEAQQGFLSSQIYCEEKKFPLIGLMSQKGLALVALQSEDYNRAKYLLEPVLKGYQEFNFQTEINHVNALLSQTYLSLGDASQAEEFANKVMSLSDDPSHIEYKAIAARVLSQRYVASKQYKLAYDYLESHQHYTNLMLDDTKAKANAYQMAKFKHRELAREIALLNQERELLQTQKELDQSDRTNNLMIVTMLIGSIFFLSLFVIYSHRQKMRYRKLALTDRLTGVYNRGAGQDFAENEFVQVSVRQTEFSVVVFDLDLFKNINDSYGHGTGDWTLKHVVSAVKPLIRDSDIFTRMGGEEFALFLPYSNETVALGIAERCKEAIAAIDTKYSGHAFNISASFGVAGNTVEDLSLDPLLKRADIALYASKHSGRNRVTLYTAELESEALTDEANNPLVFS